jgi:multidrug efflux system outer membrane protein
VRNVVALIRRGIALGLCLICPRPGTYYLWALHHESTDDAFIDGHMVHAAPQVGGRVRRVLVTDNQPVRAGDLLVEIDPADFRVKLDQAIAAENIENQRSSVALTADRLRTGLASELDVRQARSLLATTESEVPVLESQREQSLHALGVLVGREPNALQDDLARPAPIPGAAASDALAVRIPLGLPSDLLRRRPDVRRAEREVAAATARIGVATADLFPKVSLTGLAGFESVSASDFFTSGSRYFTAGPTISWRIFEGGRLRATVALQDARADQALHGYVKAVLTALEDVEDGLVAYGKERNRHDALVSAAEENRRSVVLARDLYVHGLGTFLAVPEADRTQYASEDTLVQGDEALVLDLVATYKALGGGWAPPAEEVAAR